MEYKIKSFNTVGELITYLEDLGRERQLILDMDGNTTIVTSHDIALWDDSIDDSPVAIFVGFGE